MCRLFCILTLLLFNNSKPAAAQTQPTLRDLMADSMRVQGADCALFPAMAEVDTTELGVAVIEPRRFTPVRQQVEIVEKQLAEKGLMAIARPTIAADAMLAFIQSVGAFSYIHAHLPVYKRQYYGFYNAQHQPCLYINFVEEPGSGWLYRQIAVMDGGAAFWCICYNLTTSQFYGFSVNSEG